VGVRPPGANGGTDSGFLNLDRLGPDRTDRAGPWTVRDRAGPWTVRDRGPSGFRPDRPGPDRVQYSSCIYEYFLNYTSNSTWDARDLTF
jgi:hypothetical protein